MEDKNLMKKLLAVILSLAVACACAVPSFAAIKWDSLIPNQGNSGKKNPQVATAVAKPTNPDPASSTEPTTSTVDVLVSGMFDNIDRNQILNRINQIRKEAYEEHLVSTYVPVQWSSDMEAIATQRAVESMMSANSTHTRTDGSVWYTADHDGVEPDGENLDWGRTAMDSIEYWYQSKQTYMETQDAAQAGNYINLINPSYKYIGLRNFSVGEGTIRRCTCLEFSKADDLPTGPYGTAGTSTEQVTVLKKKLTYHLNGASSTAVGKRIRYEVVGYYADNDADAYNGTFTVSLKDKPTWKSSNPSVATISEDGILTALDAGTTTVSGTVNGKTVGKKVTVS